MKKECTAKRMNSKARLLKKIIKSFVFINMKDLTNNMLLNK